MEGQYIPEGALGKVWRVLDRCIMFTTVVGSLASVMFIGAMFLNVIMRYVFSSPIWWFDEMIIALLVWYSALGTVVCYWTNAVSYTHLEVYKRQRLSRLHRGDVQLIDVQGHLQIAQVVDGTQGLAGFHGIAGRVLRVDDGPADRGCNGCLLYTSR